MNKMPTIYFIEAQTVSATVTTTFSGKDIVRITTVEDQLGLIVTGQLALRGDSSNIEFMKSDKTRRYGKLVDPSDQGSYTKWSTDLDEVMGWFKEEILLRAE